MTDRDGIAALRLAVELYLRRLLPFLEDQMEAGPEPNEAMTLHTLGEELRRSIASKVEPLIPHSFVPCPKHGGLCWAGGAISETACHQVSDGKLCGQPEHAHIAEPEPSLTGEHATEER